MSISFDQITSQTADRGYVTRIEDDKLRISGKNKLFGKIATFFKDPGPRANHQIRKNFVSHLKKNMERNKRRNYVILMIFLAIKTY
jgi:hypothetical protein